MPSKFLLFLFFTISSAGLVVFALLDVVTQKMATYGVVILLILATLSLFEVIMQMAFAPRKNNKIGVNETCPCGSGKKYKKCCKKII